MRATILYEDGQVIVACKPAGLATQTAEVGQADMVSELKNYLKSPYLGLVHRLDQPVEGVLVFGKTRTAAADLSRQLSRGILNKKYYAVVCGQPAQRDAELTDYLLRTADGRAEVVPPETADAKKAVLRYRIVADCRPDAGLGQNPGNNDSDVTIYLADILIGTGRFHQIRAQMAHAGMPLLGDVKYGSEVSRQLSAALHVGNVALCAYDLQFAHPVTRRQMSFRIEPKEAVFRRFPVNFQNKPK